MSHMGFVVSAYLVSALVVAALVAWAHFDGRAQARALDELGDTRREGGRR